MPEKETAILKQSEQVLKIESYLAKWAASDDFFFLKCKNICFLFQNSFRVIVKIGEQVLMYPTPSCHILHKCELLASLNKPVIIV